MTTKRKHHYLRWHPLHTAHHTSHVEREHPAHDPPLTLHDEAVYLLHIGAEVEHSLLVQYLYAAYSLKKPDEVPPDKQALVRSWKKTLLGIAREEMGHLITVQNLLRLIGGPLTFDREDYPFHSDLYPFHFRLEPLSRASLAKYIVAEMPLMTKPSDEIEEIIQRATDVATMHVNRVGSIYARILHLLSPFAIHDTGNKPHLPDNDFLADVNSQQAHYEDWGNGKSVLVPEVGNRDEALSAIGELAEQGEGLEESDVAPSHYQRLLAIYEQFPEPGEWEPTYAVPTDPSTSLAASSEETDADLTSGRITHPLSRMWAQLANMRYRLLLCYLSHFLQTDGPTLDDQCDYTPRGFLNKWTFDEMRRLSQLAGKLATLPRLGSHPDLPDRAGLPFELPYSLSLPDRESDRWRHHLNVIEASIALMEQIRKAQGEADDAFLQELLSCDREAEKNMRAVANGKELPAQTGQFKKVVRILEDSVRGFHIGAHHNFWRDCTRDELVSKSIFGNPLIAVGPDGRFSADNSNLIKALRGEAPFDAPDDNQNRSRYPRMPAEHPPLPPAGIEFIRQWIYDGCPDNDPPGQIGIQTP